jgi:hypothetical protein
MFFEFSGLGWWRLLYGCGLPFWLLVGIRHFFVWKS